MNIDDVSKKFIEDLQKSFQKEKDIVEVHPIMSPKVNAIQRLKMIAGKYGMKFLEWREPETLWKIVSKDFNIPDLLTNENYRDEKDQIMAIKTAILTDQPWLDFNIFEKCGQAFNGNIVNFSQSQALSPAECCWTVKVLQFIRNTEEFSKEVQRYIALCFKDRGFVYIPEPCEFCNDELDELGNDIELKTMTINLWNKAKSKDMSLLQLTEDRSADIQIARLFTIQEYLKDMEKL